MSENYSGWQMIQTDTNQIMPLKANKASGKWMTGSLALILIDAQNNSLQFSVIQECLIVFRRSSKQCSFVVSICLTKVPD